MTEKTLDVLFAKVVHALQPDCQRCGAPTTDCAHIFTRSRRSTRWDTENALGLCRTCHAWAHAKPYLFTLLVASRTGVKQLEALHRRSLVVSKDRDLDAIAASLRLLLKQEAVS